MHACTGFSVVSSTIYIIFLVPGRCRFRLVHHFCLFYVDPQATNFDDAVTKASTILWITSTLSSAKSSYLTSIFEDVIFVLKCATAKRSAFWRDWM